MRKISISIGKWIFLALLAFVVIGIGALIGFQVGELPGSYVGILIALITTRVFLRFIPLAVDVVRYRLQRKSPKRGSGQESVASGMSAVSKRKLHKAFVGLAVLVVLVGATILYHDGTYNSVSLACTEAKVATSLDERRALLDKAYALSNRAGLFIPPKTWIGSDPIKRCDAVDTELTKMLQQGDCSQTLLKDVSCRCGLNNWFPENPPRECTPLESRYPACEINSLTGQREINCY